MNLQEELTMAMNEEIPKPNGKFTLKNLFDLYHSPWKNSFEATSVKPVDIKGEDGFYLIAQGNVQSDSRPKTRPKGGRTKTFDGPGLWHRCTIRLTRTSLDEPFSINDKVECKCTCEAFHFGLAYHLYKLKGLFGRPSKWNKTAPKVVNTAGKVSLCKHLMPFTRFLLKRKIIGRN